MAESSPTRARATSSRRFTQLPSVGGDRAQRLESRRIGRAAQTSIRRRFLTDPGADQLAGVGSPLLVRTGSVPHRSHRDRGGHQRSRGVRRAAVHRHCTPNTWAAGVARQRVQIPPTAAAGRRALANKSGAAGTGLTLWSSWCLHCQAPATVVLIGRATTVPFTAVLTGPQQTIRDNATATSTCAVACRRRSPPCSIWLCKHVVNGLALIGRAGRPIRPRRGGPERRRRPRPDGPERPRRSTRSGR